MSRSENDMNLDDDEFRDAVKRWARREVLAGRMPTWDADPHAEAADLREQRDALADALRECMRAEGNYRKQVRAIEAARDVLARYGLD